MTCPCAGQGASAALLCAAFILLPASSPEAQETPYAICAKSVAELQAERRSEIASANTRMHADIDSVQQGAMQQRLHDTSEANRAFQAELASIRAEQAERAREGVRGQARNLMTRADAKVARLRLANRLKAINQHWNRTTKEGTVAARQNYRKSVEMIRRTYGPYIVNRQKARCDPK